MIYNDRDYAAQRLHNTIIREGKTPVLIIDIPPAGSCSVLKLSTNRERKVDYNLLDMTPVPLGFINYDDTCFFAVRKPMRRDWRQGLRSNNFFSCSPDYRYLTIDKGMYKQLAKTIEGDYPSFTRALNIVHGGFTRFVAFSRGFCISNEDELFYKAKFKVGGIKNGVPVLARKFNYLDRVLKESVAANV